MKSVQFHYKHNKDWKGLEEAKKLDSENSLIVVFFAPLFAKEEERFKELQSHFPKAKITGCSSAGEISDDHIKDKSLTCIIIKFENSSFLVKSMPLTKTTDSFATGKQLVSHFDLDNLKGLLVFSDGLNANGSELVKGINSCIDKDKTVVSGGLAGDGSDFKETYVLEDNKISGNQVLAIGFYGESLSISHGSKGGWDIFGPKRQITKSSGNILYELDGKPALTLYKEYLGTHAKDLPASGLFFPLEISFKNNNKKFVRTILSIDEEDLSLIFAGDIPQGAVAQLMRANIDNLIDGASGALEQTNTFELSSEDSHEVIFAISCVGRRLVLGAKADEEVEAIYDLTENSNIIGFYSYGELSPLVKGSPCELHNQSMTIMRLSEKEAA